MYVQYLIRYFCSSCSGFTGVRTDRKSVLKFKLQQTERAFAEISSMSPGEACASETIHIEIVSKQIGRGIFANKSLPEYTFIGTYPGELITKEIADTRNITYKRKKAGCFLFDFKSKTTSALRDYLFKQYGVVTPVGPDSQLELCFDPTYADKSNPNNKLCIVNHSIRHRNLKYNLMFSKAGFPFICFFTCKSISEAYQLYFDYGDKSHDSPDWCKK